METEFQNVTILLEKIYLSQLTACIIALVCSSKFFTIIMKHPVLSRFVRFYNSLRHSACHEVQVLAMLLSRDVKSTLGRNNRFIQEETNLNPWSCSPSKLKEALIERYWVDVPPMDKCRLPYLCKLLTQRREAFNKAMKEEEERLSHLIDSLVRN